MAIYKCKICGAVYDEEKEHKPVSALSGCPVCKQPVSNLVPLYENGEQAAVPQPAYAGELSYDGNPRDGGDREIHRRRNEHQNAHAELG